MDEALEQLKKCPKCKEDIKKDATRCKHCGEKLDFGSKLTEIGKGITGCGCALMLLPIIIFLILMLLGLF